MRLILAAILLFIAQPSVIFADTSSLCPGEEGYFYTNARRRTPKAGGFVANTAYVDDNDDLYLAPTAAVCGNAQLYGSARILGRVVITGNAEVYGSANIKGNARIEGDSTVSGKARIQDNVIVRDSDISGTTKLKGYFKAVGKTISGGTYDAPQFTQAQLDAQRRAEEEEARRRAAAERQRQKAAAKAKEKEAARQRTAAANKKITDRRKNALKYVSEAKKILELYALKAEKTTNSIWTRHSGRAEMTISNTDPCQFTITGSGGTNPVKINLRYRQNISSPFRSTFTDLSSLSNSERKSFNHSAKYSYYDRETPHYRAAWDYFDTNPTKVDAWILIFGKKPFSDENYSHRDYHRQNSALPHRSSLSDTVQYFNNDNYRLGLIFPDTDESIDFKKNIIEAYNKYCPTDETK